MTLDIQAKVVSTEELFAMPEDGINRDLIRGEIREREMTRRNPDHSSILVAVSAALYNWNAARTGPQGRVYGGEVGFRLHRNPDSTVGIDVAYVDAETVARTPKGARLVEGPPVIAIEVLSPSDKQEEITEKVQEYLDCGTRQVWVLEPVFETVTIYKLSGQKLFLTADDELVGDADLPGFRCAVSKFFQN